MANKYDKIIKENLRMLLGTLVNDILGFDPKETEMLPTKMQITNEREADFILKVKSKTGEFFLLHIEFQSTNDSTMVYRMLRYWVYIKQKYNLPIKQYVFYIGSKPMSMKYELNHPEINYCYKQIDMRNIDGKQFLKSNKPEEVILTILCNYGGKDVRSFVKEILGKLKLTAKGELALSKYIKQFEIISQLRGLQKIVEQEEKKMAITFDLEKDIRFKQGRRGGKLEGLCEGKREGKREGLCEGLQKGIKVGLEIKFGVKGKRLFEKVKNVDDVKKLDNINDLIRDTDELSEIEEFIKMG